MNFVLLSISFIVTVVLAMLLRMVWKEFWLSFGTCFMTLFLLSDVIVQTYRLFRGNGIYDYLDFGGDSVRRFILFACLVETFVGFIIFVFSKLIYKKQHDSVLTTKKGYKVLPFFSLQCLIMIFGGIWSVFSIADTVMPQYGLWEIENKNIVQNRAKGHIAAVANESKIGYPLWEITDFDNNIQENSGILDTKRILVLGDSFIWGDGTSNVNVLWWRQFQQILDEKGYGKCSVIAVGKNGASTEDELRWLTSTTMIDDINPDLILIGYVTNDGQHIENGKVSPKQWLPKDYREEGFLSWINFIFPNVAYYLNNELQRREIADMKFNEDTGFSYEQWELENVIGKNKERYEELALKPLKSFLDKINIPYAVIMTPGSIDYEYYKERYDIMIPILKECGLTVYDPFDSYIDIESDDKEYKTGINPVNGHPGFAMNKLLADYVFQVVESDYGSVLDSTLTEKKPSLVINDWYPHCAMPKMNGNRIDFIYGGQDWQSEDYLYLPQKTECIKICFSNSILLKNIELYDSNNAPVQNAKIWVSYIGENGYESSDLFMLSKKDKYFLCNISAEVTALYIHMPLPDESCYILIN